MSENQFNVEFIFTDHKVEIADGSGILSPEDFQDYWKTIVGAFMVHLDRDRIREGLWKEYPAADQVNQIRVKADRIIRNMELENTPDRMTNSVSELHDIINYSNFAIRILEGSV